MRKAGYIWLKDAFDLECLDYWITSHVQEKGSAQRIERDGYIKELYRPSDWPGEHWSDHLGFALKKEGLHLELLRQLMPLLGKDEVLTYVLSSPTGRYSRITWYLYESFTSERLPLDDLTQGNYVPLASPELYLTSEPRRVRRQRINHNLLGSLDFSPMLRRTNFDFEEVNQELKKQCSQVVENFPDSIYQRAVNYLYAKESKSSYAIERETPSAQRARTFVRLLEDAGREDFINQSALVALQNAIVDSRYANNGYRDQVDEQIYVGESIAPGTEKIHYVAPKPEDTAALMKDFLAMSHATIKAPCVPDLVAASVISYIFNFIHPFSDGNGRIHRFLIHHVLAMRKFSVEGIILPISAVMLNRQRDYDTSLESFSKHLMDKLEYELDDRLRLKVIGKTVDHYRYIDCTCLVEIFYDFVKDTISTELPAEAEYLQRYDQARRHMREIVDMPDRYADLFIKLCGQNKGVLSLNKRKLEEFRTLSENEITQLQKIVQTCFPENLA